MKRTVLFLTIALSVSAAFAQKGKVTSAETLLASGDVEKAKEAIDEALESEKSNTWPKTYITAAKVYQELDKKGKDDEGTLKAYNFYAKAIELDEKGDAKGKKIGKYKKEISQALLFFSGELTNEGVEAFNKEDFKNAVAAFEYILELNSNPYMIELQKEEKIDTSIIFNTALAAYNGEMWEKAEKYFDQSIGYKYGGGDAILLMQQVYAATGDSAKMGPNLIRGFETYPEDDRILTSLINFYLETNQNDKALDYLNKAIDSDPQNPSFYYARAVLNDNSKQFDVAVADYSKCLEIDAEYFNALYNLGVMYFNKGVEEMNLANEETNFKKFEAKKDVAEATFKEALPFFESALSIKPEEVAVLESLKTLYYRFEMNDKYKEVSDKLKSL